MMRMRFLCDRTGSALVELAVVLPVLLVILLGALDFARVFYVSMTLNNAARAGAQYGAQDATTVADTVGMQSIAVTSAAANVSGVTVVATRVCQCATDADPAATAPADCTAVLPTCGASQRLVISARVTTSATFSRLVPALLPGVPASITVERTATLRAQ